MILLMHEPPPFTTNNVGAFWLLQFSSMKKEMKNTVLDPTHERWTNTENRIGPNLWLLINNRRDAVYFRRSQGRIKHSIIEIGKQQPLIPTMIYFSKLTRVCQ